MLNDPLAAALTKILNAEKIGKKEVVIRPASKMIKKILLIMNEHRYIGSFEEVEEGQNTVLKLSLLGNINKCGVVKPRFSAKYTNFEKWEKRYLPAHNFGILMVSTSKGIVTQSSAKENKIGGKLLAYCY
ncbi:30S ribosomal protein S8 [Candidatus Woesearchaeota archaeon]|jgi:small subunit ribosomal protein S8|nr:30S ribosomal protein S8 [Candidatus Woesearchaeota archaeon]